MSRLKTFYINYNIERVNILFKNMNIYPNTCSLQEDSKDPNNSSRNVKLIEDHLNDKILLSSSCHRFTHLGYDLESTVSYFQIVKNALEYPY